MQYARMVVGYHGCDAEVAERILDGTPFTPSRNDYDWLGLEFRPFLRSVSEGVDRHRALV